MKWLLTFLTGYKRWPSTGSGEAVGLDCDLVWMTGSSHDNTGVSDGTVFRDIDLHRQYKTFEIDITEIGSSLPRRIMGSSEPELVDVVRKARGKEGDNCVICMESMVAGDEITDFLPCNHTHHMHCAVEWLTVTIETGRSGRCPQCNAEIMRPISKMCTIHV